MDAAVPAVPAVMPGEVRLGTAGHGRGARLGAGGSAGRWPRLRAHRCVGRARCFRVVPGSSGARLLSFKPSLAPPSPPAQRRAPVQHGSYWSWSLFDPPPTLPASHTCLPVPEQTHVTMAAPAQTASTRPPATACPASRDPSVRRTSTSVPATPAAMGPTAQTAWPATRAPALQASVGSTVRITRPTARRGGCSCRASWGRPAARSEPDAVRGDLGSQQASAWLHSAPVDLSETLSVVWQCSC